MKKKRKWTFIVLSFSFLFWICDSIATEEKPEHKESFFKKFSVSSIKKTPKNIFQIKQNTALIKKKHLKELLRSFVRSGLPNRMVGSSGHKNARDFIMNDFLDGIRQVNSLFYVDSFTPKTSFAKKQFNEDFNNSVVKHYAPESEIYKKGKKFTNSRISYLDDNQATLGKNIIWEKRGLVRPDDVLIITAHYDSLALDSSKVLAPKVNAPGADDNASGVALAFCLIKIISHLDIPITVRVVFMDWEEFGGLGSVAFKEKYTQEFKKKKLVGIINLIALGHDSKTSDKEKRYGNMKAYISRPGSPYFSKEKIFAEGLLKYGKKASAAPKFDLVANEEPLEGSPGFWEKSWPSVSFSQNWQDDANIKRVHTSDDFVETLNFVTLYNSYKFISGAVQGLLFSP